MAEPYLSEIRIFSFNFPPKGWAFCNGQHLPINQNQALFALLGTTYGGNGQTTFALPDLRGKVPMHWGVMNLGNTGGEENHNLTISEMPQHTHIAVGKASPPNANTPAGNFWASDTGFTPYGTTPAVAMHASGTSNVGGSQAHFNMSPYLTLNFCIALQGIFPSPN